MTFLTFMSLWILLLCLISQSYTSGTGKVFIGYMPNSSLTQSGSFFSKVSVSSTAYYLPIFVKVFDDVNGSIVLPLKDNVSVECETNINTTGFSMVSFSPLILSEGIPEGIVNISLINAGRPVEVRCFGNSILINSSICPNNTQFKKETSISDAWPLIVLPKPVVSISSRTIAVPSTTNSFRVEFSEPVKDFPIIVSCNPVDPANISELVIFDVNVTIDSSYASMKYYLSNGSITSPIKVSCTLKQIGDGQFENTLPDFPLWFVPNEVYVDLISPVRQVKSLIFETFLIPRRLSGQEIKVQCYSNTVHSQKEATEFFDSISCPKKNTATNSATTPANSSSTTRARTPASSSSTTRTTLANFTGTSRETPRTINQMNPWVVHNPNFFLKAEGATLELRRQLPVQEPTLELVTLVCCVSLTPGVQVLHSRKLTLSVVASLQPYISYNQSELIPVSDVRPTPVGNPAKKTFANCPCDMTWNNCDVNCCCDKDCNVSDADTFSKCSPSYWGGQSPPKPHWMCDNNSTRTGLCALLCVHTQDSAYLGLYRREKSTIPDLHIFKNEWIPGDQFSKPDSSNPQKPADFNYKYASPIHTTTLKEHTHITEFLALPQRTFSGQCATTAPIRFLTDMSSDCIYQMTPDLCSDNSVLSATNFALSTTLISLLSPAMYVTLNGIEQKNVQTDVNYYCASNPQTYLKSWETLSDILDQGLESSQNFTIPDSCIIDNSGLYHCSDNMDGSFSTMDEDLPPRCPWDNGYTKPSAPILRTDSNNYQCDNIVLRVQYHFTWSGNKIDFLNASIILGNVSFFNVKQQKNRVYYSETITDPITNLTNTVSRTFIRNTTLNESTQLNPHYEVKYTHNFNETKDNSSDKFLRSGNPGYNFGKLIWSGTSVINETSGKLLYVNRNETQQINVWKPSPSGLCSLAGKRKVMFGEDLFSSCFVPLTIDSLNDCQMLRKWLLYQLSLLMPSDRIGRYGSNNAQRSSDWINILRDDLTDQFPDLVPVAESNATNTNNSNSTTIDTTTSGTTEPTVANNQNNFSKGACIQVPSGIILDIMYANTGLVQGSPIKEIIGARASYVFDNWTFTCTNNFIGGSCVSPWNINNTDPENAERYQLFTLTSMVHFTQVPETRPEPIMRYYSLPTSRECWFDICFQNIILPIKRQPGEDTELFMYKLGVTLIIVFMALLFGFSLSVL